MKCLRSVLCGLGLLLAAAAAPAQQARVNAQIPFDFVVGNQVLPAGEYTIVPQGDSQAAVWIRSTGSNDSALALTFACAKLEPAPTTKLVFHIVNGRYFLTQIWSAGYQQGRELPKSKTEIRLAKNSSTEVFVLAANLTH